MFAKQRSWLLSKCAARSIMMSKWYSGRQQLVVSLCAHNKHYSTHSQSSAKKTTILDIKKKYRNNSTISVVTAYDYCSAKHVDQSGVDIVLVGDSLGMVVMGGHNTSQVTVDQMVHHCQAVMRGATRCFVVADMPFGSYEVSPTDAVRNAMRIVKEGGVDAVKLEGAHNEQVRAIVRAGIPVMGHIGLKPQSVTSFGGFRLQGKTCGEGLSILSDAQSLQESGCFAIVIEMVSDIVARQVTKLLTVPTIGIGAGNGTSGQVLVYHDMLGLYSDFVSKFCKQYANLSPIIVDALQQYRREVEDRSFPAMDYSYPMSAKESQKFLEKIQEKIRMKNINSVVVIDKPESSDSTKINSTVTAKSSTNSSIVSELPCSRKLPKVAIVGSGVMASFFCGQFVWKPSC